MEGEDIYLRTKGKHDKIAKSAKAGNSPLTKTVDDDIIIAGAISGAYSNDNDPDGSKREAHAKKYYNSMKNSDKKTIVDTISKNSKADIEDISKMYDHLLVNKYDLDKGHTNFDEDYNIAESLRRLREGKDIQEHDLLLIKHEALEYDLMNKEGLSYTEAHAIANKSFNYQYALEMWLDKNRK